MTQTLFLLLRQPCIDTNTPVCLTSLFHPLLSLVLLSQGQDLPQQGMWVPTEVGTVCKHWQFCPQGQSLWPLALGGKVLTAVSLRNPFGPHQAVAGTQQLSHPQHRPDPGPCSGAKARSGREGIESVSMGCLHKVLVDRDAVGREKKQPKQLHKYTGGSWQTEATRRASFRLRVMRSAPSRARALLAPGWEDTHTSL